MERNEVAIADALEVGDRFYKLGDAKKELLQMVAPPVYATVKTNKVFYVKAFLIDRGFHADRLKNYAMSINSATQIVFIRNVHSI